MINESKNTSLAQQSAFSIVMQNMHKIGISIFVLAVLWILPLYHRGLFNQITEMKFIFYRNVSFIIFGFLLIATLVYASGMFASRKKLGQNLGLFNRFDRFSVTDWFVLSYLGAALISYWIQDWPQNVALWGLPTKRMGLMTQISLVLAYFYVSRYFCIVSNKTVKIWREYKPHAVILCVGMLLTAFVVMLLGLFHRFWFDPLGLYEGFHPGWVFNALSTIGNPNRYSGFVALMLPFGLFIYWHTKVHIIRILAVAYIAVGFATAVTQNSESIFVALFAVLMVLFWFSFASNTKMKRFLEIIIIMLASFVLVGVFQHFITGEGELLLQMKALSLFLSRSVWTRVLLVFFVVLYAIFLRLDKKSSIDVSALNNFRLGSFIAVFAGLFLLIIYIIFNSTLILPASLRRGGLFLFTDDWGNHRGFNWRIAIATFMELPLMQKFFGAGPEGFWQASTAYFAAEVHARYDGRVLVVDAHNEWITAFVNGGILGGIAYIGIFFTAFKRYAARIADYPFLLSVCATIAGYMAHNFFTYQTINCTPALFIFIGVAEALLREGEKLQRIYLPK